MTRVATGTAKPARQEALKAAQSPATPSPAPTAAPAPPPPAEAPTAPQARTLQPAPTQSSIQGKIVATFGGGALGQQALCIARMESGYRANATGYNRDGSYDRGVFQINSKAHPNVSDAQAYDPDFNIRYAYQMRLSWGNWNAWMARHKCGL